MTNDQDNFFDKDLLLLVKICIFLFIIKNLFIQNVEDNTLLL